MEQETKLVLIVIVVMTLITIIYIVYDNIRNPHYTVSKADRQMDLTSPSWSNSKKKSVYTMIFKVFSDNDLRLSKTTVTKLTTCIVEKLANKLPNYSQVLEMLRRVSNGGEMDPITWETYVSCLRQNMGLISEDLHCKVNSHLGDYTGKKNFGAIIHHYVQECRRSQTIGEDLV